MFTTTMMPLPVMLLLDTRIPSGGRSGQRPMATSAQSTSDEQTRRVRETIGTKSSAGPNHALLPELHTHTERAMALLKQLGDVAYTHAKQGENESADACRQQALPLLQSLRYAEAHANALDELRENFYPAAASDNPHDFKVGSCPPRSSLLMRYRVRIEVGNSSG